MENSEQKKNKDHGMSFLKNIFEIRRPVKQQSSTLPRRNTKMEEESDKMNKDRLFVRHQSYRRSSRKNKYKKDSSPKNTKEKYAVEPESNVKKLCQQFEEKHSNTEQTVNQLSSSKSPEDLAIEKVLTNKAAYLEFLKDIHQTTEVKKRVYEKNPKQTRESKIKSFVEAENDEETEEYRKSLINEIDLEIAQMKEDGFIDDEENVIVDETREILDSLQIIEIEGNGFIEMKQDEEEQSVWLDELRSRELKPECELYRSSIDSDNQTIIFEGSQPENDASIEIEDFANETSVTPDVDLKNIIRYSDEFTESLCEDVENGLFVVEAYNDDGRELIEVQVVIDRRTVSLISDKTSLEDAIHGSDMVFYQNEDHSFNVIQNSKSPDLTVKENNIEHRPSLKESHEHLNEYTEMVVCLKNDAKQSSESLKLDELEQSPSTSNYSQENLYEYIEIPNEDNPQEPFLVFAPLSNRSTIYSTTSQESSVFDEDDEGIELGRNKDNQEEIYSNVRRETFCDDKGIVRIERVAFSDNLQFGEGPLTPVSRSNSTASCKRLEFIIDEIKSTEKKYVDDLAKVVKSYKPYIERHTPPNLKVYQGYLFGNLEKIYRRQRKFLSELEKTEDVDEVIQCFVNHELLFELYPNYFRNKPKADNLLKEFTSIIKEMQEVFEERLDFSAYLLTPVQRLGKYILFLENIEKQLVKLDLPAENAQVALAMIRDEMSKGNDSVAIESIENSPISKMDYGSFKMREKFSISKPRKVEAMVFLFQNVLVFTTWDPLKLEIFYYYDSIKMNDLRIATFDDFTIHLTDFTKSKKKQNTTKYTYILEVKTEKVWKTWKEAIEKMLWEQLVKAKEQTKSQNFSNRYKSRNKNRIKSTGSSIFYCE